MDKKLAKQIKTMWEAGANVHQIAFKVGVSYRTIENYLAKIRASGELLIRKEDKVSYYINTETDNLKPEIPTLNWKIAHSEKEKTKKPFKTYLVISDLHIPFVNVPAVRSVLKLMTDVLFDGFVIAGDALDMTPVSHWLHDKNKNKSLEGKRLLKDYIEANKLLDEFDTRLPKNCDKHFLFGNHEKWYFDLIEKIPALDGCFSPTKELKLKERQYKVYEEQNHILRLGKLSILHGIYATSHPTYTHLNKYLTNIMFGHTHTLEQGMLHSMAKELSLVGYNIGCLCYDNTTEVLTDYGWKNIMDITLEDRVTAYNPETEYSQLEYPIAINKYNYTGKMMHFSGNRVDLLVTPNHKMLWKGSSWTMKQSTAEELYKHRKNYAIPVAGKFCNGLSADILIAKLLAWIITEGSLDKQTKDIAIYQKKEPYVTEIRELLTKLNINYNFYTDKRQGVHRFRLNRISSMDLLQWFENEDIRRIPRRILNSNFSLLEVFWKELLKGDGTISKNNTEVYSTINLSLVEDIVELLHKINKGSTVKKMIHSTKFKRNAEIFTITAHQNNMNYYKTKECIDYSGDICGITVPSGFLYVRRNGYISISGNSDINPKYMENKPNRWNHGFAIVYLYENGYFDVDLKRIVKGKFVFNNKMYNGN